MKFDENMRGGRGHKGFRMGRMEENGRHERRAGHRGHRAGCERESRTERMMREGAAGIGARMGPWGEGPLGGPIGRGPWGDEFGAGPRGPGRGRGGDGRERSRGGPRGARGRRMFRQGELRLVLLALIEEQDRHGYELIKAIEELTGGHYAPSPGAVYPQLAMLTDEGLIAEAESDDSRRPFTLTDAGQSELDAGRAIAEAAIARLKQMGADEPRESPPIRRAVGNLLTATRNRAMQEGFSDDTAKQIAAILDEAAGRIERL